MPTPHLLTVDTRTAPLGLDNPRPEFGWALHGPAAQRAYEVEVATAASFAKETIVWASGVVVSDTPFGVTYAGGALTERTAYHWRVRVHLDDDTVTDWAAADFETGILNPDTWKARWITDHRTDAKNPRTLYFHTNITLPAPVVHARAYASALGWYRLYINDTDITGHSLVPRWTPFFAYTEYQAYDVTDALRAGENRIGIVVSEGRYRGELGVQRKSARYGDKIAAFAQLELDLADGSHVQVLTDGTWTVSYGRIHTADPKNGERVDLRLAELPWNSAEGSTADSTRATILAKKVPLIAESVDRVTVIGQRTGTISQTPSGKQLVDFGQNFSGVARVRLSGPRGALVKMLYSEVLDPDGELSTGYLEAGGGGGSADKWFQRDEVTLAGDAVEYTPAFTIRGFRYLLIDGPANPVTPDDVEGLVISTDLPQIATFTSSDSRLNQLWSNVLWSLRSNFTDTPTDCPTRERSGWTGDIQVFGPTASQMVDADAYLRRYLRNAATEQSSDGRVPPIIPSEAAPGVSTSLMRFTSTSVGWGDVTVLLPWTLYRYYGDKTVLADQYDSARLWVDQLARRAATKRSLRRRVRRGIGDLERYLVDTGYHWGEWLRPGETLMSELPGNFYKRSAVATAYLAHSARTLAAIANVLDKTTDERHYAEIAENTTRAWRAAFVTAEGARIGDDKQDDYVRALAFTLLPENQRPRAAKRLAELVTQAGYHLGTGFLSTPMLLQTLVDTGYPDVAYKVLLQTTVPSWLGQVEHGATTTWETWEGYRADGKPTASHNHYAFGSVVAFLQERVAGLTPAEPGYRSFRVAPIIGGDLTSAAVEIRTPYGPAASAWDLADDGTLTLHVTVPAGATANIRLGDIDEEATAGTHTFRTTIAAVRAGTDVDARTAA